MEASCTRGAPPVAQKPNRPPTPVGRDSLTYPVFAASDRRLLVLKVRVPTEDLGGQFRKCVEVEVDLDGLAETLGRHIRQARQAVEVEVVMEI